MRKKRKRNSVPDPFEHLCRLCWGKRYFNIAAQKLHCKCGWLE
jgi:hypothetical protein